MPRLTRTITNLARMGPILSVILEPILTAQELTHEAGEVIPSVSFHVFLDTGASGSAVPPVVFDGFDMADVGGYSMNTPSTTTPILVPEYRVRLVLSKHGSFETNVAAVPMGGQHIQGRIGRDILEQCVPTYNGPKNSFTLNVRDQRLEEA